MMERGGKERSHEEKQRKVHLLKFKLNGLMAGGLQLSKKKRLPRNPQNSAWYLSTEFFTLCPMEAPWRELRRVQTILSRALGWGEVKRKGMLKVFTPFSFCKNSNKSLPDTHREFMLMIFSRGKEKGRA